MATSPHSAVNINQVISAQDADPYLSIIKMYLSGFDHAQLYRTLPQYMQAQLMDNQYVLYEGMLYHYDGAKFSMVLPPTPSPTHRHPLLPIVTVCAQPIK